MTVILPRITDTSRHIRVEATTAAIPIIANDGSGHIWRVEAGNFIFLKPYRAKGGRKFWRKTSQK